MMDSDLSVYDYAAQALQTDQQSDGGSLVFPLLGLFGETGSLLSEVKKKQRDREFYKGYAGAVVEELGDVLWYLAIVADRSGLSLADIVTEAHRASGEQCPDAKSLCFSSLQPKLMPRSEPNEAFEKTLFKLAGEVGVLVGDQKNDSLDPSKVLVDRLVNIVRTLIQAANEAGVTLEAAAVKNIYKISDRWPKERRYPEPFDTEFAAEERLPSKLVVDIFERQIRDRTYVFQQCNGINIGDRLTDNATVSDDYRFHDVFHFSHVAVLGWSPVFRALFRLKRKSDPKIDETQDGARAILIEEGVTTWIFGKALELGFFANVKLGELPFDLLKHVRQFVTGYEVDERPLWLWEEAILQGYAAFRFLQKHRRGRLHIDVHNHKLDIEALP